MAAVKSNGHALVYASDSIKADRPDVMKAVKNYGFALEYASESLKADPGIVAHEVQQDGHALKYAAAGLKANQLIVVLDMACKAVRYDRGNETHHSGVLYKVSRAMKARPETLAELLRSCRGFHASPVPHQSWRWLAKKMLSRLTMVVRGLHRHCNLRDNFRGVSGQLF